MGDKDSVWGDFEFRISYRMIRVVDLDGRSEQSGRPGIQNFVNKGSVNPQRALKVVLPRTK